MKKLAVMGLLVFAVLFLYRPDVFAADKIIKRFLEQIKPLKGNSRQRNKTSLWRIIGTCQTQT